MKPPLISGGNAPRATAPHPLAARFNEAAADQRRKLEDVLTGAEVRDASMKPPLISGGNLRRRSSVRPYVSALQ